MSFKGIILAGGMGTRLYPSTLVTSKQLLPINDKPMIYYPLATLMLARIREILIISTEDDIKNYQRLFGDGSHIGLDIKYEIQYRPDGIASAFKIGEKFIGNKKVCLILGDNVFYSESFSTTLSSAVKNNRKNGATIFGYKVSNPESFGIVEFSQNGKVKSIEEKPKKPKSKQAIVGLYIFDNNVVEVSKSVEPSERGEHEITDVLKVYMKRGKLDVINLKKSFAWLDTGTPSSLLDASQFVSTIEKRQGIKIGCIEEIAYRNHWITKKDLKAVVKNLAKTDYAKYLEEIIQEGK